MELSLEAKEYVRNHHVQQIKEKKKLKVQEI